MSREEMKLLPCPFCGGEAKSVGPYGESLFRVECQICTAKVSGFDQCQQDAIDAWNTRALRASAAPEDGIKPHVYNPDYQAMGDCRVCGHSDPDMLMSQHAVALSPASRKHTNAGSIARTCTATDEQNAATADSRKAEPATLCGMIAAIYGKLDAEDCAMIDREWAKQRGYILPTNGTAALAPATEDNGEREQALVDWVNLYATKGGSWLSFETAKGLIRLAEHRRPSQTDAERFKEGASLKSFLTNVPALSPSPSVETPEK